MARLNYGDALPTEDRIAGDYPVLGSGGPSGTHKHANFQAPGIVIGRKGSFGSIHWAPAGGFAIDTAYYIDSRSTSVDLRWLYYALNAVDLRGASQDVGVPGLSREAAHEVLIPVPPEPSEQGRIADFLDAETSRIDQLAKVKERSSELLEERRIALTSQLCFRGTEAVNTLRGSEIGSIGKIPRHWQVVRNKTFITEVTSLSKTGEEELLTVSHKTGITPRSEKTVYMFMAESRVGYKQCRPGDLVINTLWAWMGALGVSRYYGIVSPAYGVYRFTSNEANPEYFDYLYRTPEYVCEMTRHSKGVWTSRLRLYPESFLALNTPMPPRVEQDNIVETLKRELEPDRQLRSVIQRSSEVLAERRRALITAAVTGEFDVSTASGRGVEV
ncbi:restriction endonuclease subunit S [Actinomadura sp. CNU-125]|uniref:restriction endonuclease subunit S n=1 Tax=Actinomadura sp. CNU-125 TaxID=1904961 RepID=UPI0013017532|nr:restriction endonuclease subunit S [Actinomadura sp. CNU-125]